MAFQIFLSHSAKDADLLDRIARRLTRNKFLPYAFEWDRQPGRFIPEKIKDAIEDSDAFVVILTEHANVSAFVQQEIGYAEAKEIPVIPLVQEGTEVRLALLEGIEYIPVDLGNPKPAIDDLLDELKDLRQSRRNTNTALAFGAGALAAWWLKNKQQPPSGPGYL